MTVVPTCSAFNVAHAVLGSAQCLGNQFASLAPQFTSLISDLLIAAATPFYQIAMRLHQFSADIILAGRCPLLQDRQRLAGLLHHAQDAVQHLP